MGHVVRPDQPICQRRIDAGHGMVFTQLLQIFQCITATHLSYLNLLNVREDLIMFFLFSVHNSAIISNANGRTKESAQSTVLGVD